MKATNNILQLLYRWRSRFDAEACQRDLHDYGAAYAMLVDNHLRRIAPEDVVIWCEPIRDTYAESG